MVAIRRVNDITYGKLCSSDLHVGQLIDEAASSDVINTQCLGVQTVV